MKKSPLEIVKERFGDDRKKAKSALVKAVRDIAGSDLWLDGLNEDKGLEHVSNRKLLHLESLYSEIKKAVGSREKLVDAIAKLDNRSKDQAYRDSLLKQSTPRLWDRYQSTQKRSA
ncbi:MAG: hypothetical protein R3A47_10330 [Polyangiales bacterium]